MRTSRIVRGDYADSKVVLMLKIDLEERIEVGDG